MTNKVYKTARGRTVDMGALILQNETVRAVGNMNVNARGDVLDSADRVIDSKNRQIKRQNDRQTRATNNQTVHASSVQAKQGTAPVTPTVKETVLDTPAASGLAAALARSQNSQGKQ